MIELDLDRADGDAVEREPDTGKFSAVRPDSTDLLDATVAVDWIAAAHLLGERVDRPIAILDASNQIVVANHALTRLIDRPAAVLRGRPWVQAVVCPTQALTSAETLRDARAGLVHRAEMIMTVANRQRLEATIDFQRIGIGPGALLLDVIGTRVVQDAAEHEGHCESFLISLEPGSFGTIVESQSSRAGARDPAHCYDKIAPQSARCKSCPALDLSKSPERVRAARVLHDATGRYQLVHATRVAKNHARITERFVEQEDVRLLIEARLDRLAAQAGLSTREREVVSALVLTGDTIAEIAAAQGVSAGTVKFHVNNILRKLGADSRADLVRLLF